MSDAGTATAIGRRRLPPVRLSADGPRPQATPYDGPDPYGNPDPTPSWLEVDWRAHRRLVDVSGTQVNCIDIGPTSAEKAAATPLLLVHGLGGCWQNFLENIIPFAADRRVVALDLPGFGSSPLPEWEITIPAYGRFLNDFCDELGLRHSVPVGNSMGGLIAAEAVLDGAERYEQLVLVSAVGISNVRLKREPVEAVARVAAAMAPLSFRFREVSLRRPKLRDVAFNQIFRFPLKLRPELLWETYHGALGDSGELTTSGFIPAVGALAGYDFRERLESIQMPTLIVWGRNDRIVPPQDAAEYAKYIGGSRVEIFDRCGHLPMAERPVRFNRLLGEFLTR